MKDLIGKRLLGLFLLIVLCIPVMTFTEATPVQASAVGPLDVHFNSCSSIGVSFYYDGLEARDLYISHLKRDQFKLQVTGPNGSLAEAWQEVPVGFGTVSMGASWTAQYEGSGIEVTVGQYNVNANPPKLVGHELRFVYNCGGASVAAPATSCSSCSGAFFSFQCTGTGISVLMNGVPAVQASFDQIAGPLVLAVTTQQNQPIAIGTAVSMWALKSNEFQVHLNSSPDFSRRVVSSSICGPISVAQTTYQPTTSTVTTPAITQTTAGSTVYVVQPGDNLFRISLRFGRSMQAIASANGIVNVNQIYAGQRLIIP